MKRSWILAPLLALAACGAAERNPGEGEPPSAEPGRGMTADTAAADMAGPEGTRAGQ